MVKLGLVKFKGFPQQKMEEYPINYLLVSMIFQTMFGLITVAS